MKLTTIIIDPQAKARFSRWPIYVGPSVYKRPQTIRISLHKRYHVKERGETKTPGLTFQPNRCSFHLISDVVAPEAVDRSIQPRLSSVRSLEI